MSTGANDLGARLHSRPADRFLVTPFFLDQPAPALRLATTGSWVNYPTMAPGPIPILGENQ